MHFAVKIGLLSLCSFVGLCGVERRTQSNIDTEEGGLCFSQSSQSGSRSFFALLWLNASMGGLGRKKNGMTAEVGLGANKKLGGIACRRGVRRIGRMWEGRRHVLGYKRDSGEI